MNFPARGIEIIDALYKGVNPQDDEARKERIKLVGEQMAHEIGKRWGNKKRAGLSDDFRSPDSIAYLEDDHTISVWDIQAASGAILVTAGAPPNYPHLSTAEAQFIPCEPIDHIEDGVEPPPPVEEDWHPVVNALKEEFKKLFEQFKRNETELSLLRVAVNEAAAKRHPTLTGKVGPFNLTLDPREEKK